MKLLACEKSRFVPCIPPSAPPRHLPPERRLAGASKMNIIMIIMLRDKHRYHPFARGASPLARFKVNLRPTAPQQHRSARRARRCCCCRLRFSNDLLHRAIARTSALAACGWRHHRHTYAPSDGGRCDRFSVCVRANMSFFTLLFVCCISIFNRNRTNGCFVCDSTCTCMRWHFVARPALAHA